MLSGEEHVRELMRTMAGRAAFVRNRKGGDGPNYFLRRAVHRIEKGLVMRPRRSVFATEYIEDAVQAFEASLAGNTDPSELRWARDVLTEYFRVVRCEGVIERAMARFAALAVPPGDAKSDAWIPYQRNLAESSPVSWDELEALSMRRRSVRWFEPRAVDRGLVEKALHIAALAPSACNRQPFRYILVDDRERIAELMKLPLGVGGFWQNIPFVAVLVGRLRAYSHPRDRHVIYMDGGLSAMAFLYALETLELGACALNWPDVPEKDERIAALLGLEPDEKVLLLIALGHPDPTGLVPRSSKVSVGNFAGYWPVGEKA